MPGSPVRVPGVAIASQLFDGWLTGRAGGEVGIVVMRLFAFFGSHVRRAPAVEIRDLIGRKQCPPGSGRERKRPREPGRVERVGCSPAGDGTSSPLLDRLDSAPAGDATPKAPYQQCDHRAFAIKRSQIPVPTKSFFAEQDTDSAAKY